MKKEKVDLKIDVGLVGNNSVGKTSLIRKFVRKEIIKPSAGISTIGMDLETIVVKYKHL